MNIVDEDLEKIRQKKKDELLNKDGGSDNPDTPIKVSDSDFSQIIKKYSPVVIDCWAEWCGPCRMIGPIIESLAKDYAGKIVFGKLNVDENQKTAMQYNIMSIPTLLVFKDGKLVDQIVGAMPKDQLEPIIAKHIT